MDERTGKAGTCNGATMDGYSQEILAVVAGRETCLMVKPDTDYRDNFRAFDTDLMEWIYVDIGKGFTKTPA